MTDPELVERLEHMAGFRDVVENHLGDLLDFAAAIRKLL